MPKVEVTVRYKSFGDNDQSYYAGLKRKQRESVLKNYPGATDLKQTIITDGIPDAVRFGDLRSTGQVAVRTEFNVSDAVADEIKKRSR